MPLKIWTFVSNRILRKNFHPRQIIIGTDGKKKKKNKKGLKREKDTRECLD